MPTEVWSPGDYRVCPSCGTRHKVQDLRCTKCRTVLAGTPVRHATSASGTAAVTRSSRPLRMLLVLGVVVALAAGLWIRNLFRGAAIQDSVQASSAAAAPAEMPAPAPTWAPPVLQYPPVVGYNRGTPPSAAGLALPGSPSPAADDTATAGGMVSIAPPTEPTRKTAFTNEDLERTRGGAAAAPTTGVASASAVASASVPAPADGARDEWVARVRDREDDVHKAQAKVRRLEAEVEIKKAQAASLSGDPEARDQAQKDVLDALDDLEKAERKLADRQRDLDEEKDRARAAGVRFER